jgi:hypothetical protein
MTIAAPSAPDFYGSSLDLASNEILTIQNIDRKLLAIEPKLYGLKWFDYRPLHPATATYLMVHHYNRAYGDFVGRALNHNRRFMTAFKGKDFMQVHERKSFWRLRQRIDEMGIRYEFFLREAMNWYIKHGWGKQAKHPPRPGQMAANDELLLDVSNAWARECRAKIQFASHARYRASQWVAAPDQLAYQEYLVTSIKRRPHQQYGLHSALYLYGCLRIEEAVLQFPPETVVAAINYCLAG